MAITLFINGHRFDYLEDKRVLGIAFEMVCVALRVGDCDDGVKRAIAAKITHRTCRIRKTQSRYLRCEQALQDIRRPKQAGARRRGRGWRSFRTEALNRTNLTVPMWGFQPTNAARRSRVHPCRLGATHLPQNAGTDPVAGGPAGGVFFARC